MMFEILEPCRVLRLGTSSKKNICKTNKNRDKNKNKNEKKKKVHTIKTIQNALKYKTKTLYY